MLCYGRNLSRSLSILRSGMNADGNMADWLLYNEQTSLSLEVVMRWIVIITYSLFVYRNNIKYIICCINIMHFFTRTTFKMICSSRRCGHDIEHEHIIKPQNSYFA